MNQITEVLFPQKLSPKGLWDKIFPKITPKIFISIIANLQTAVGLSLLISTRQDWVWGSLATKQVMSDVLPPIIAFILLNKFLHKRKIDFFGFYVLYIAYIFYRLSLNLTIFGALETLFLSSITTYNWNVAAFAYLIASRTYYFNSRDSKNLCCLSIYLSLFSLLLFSQDLMNRSLNIAAVVCVILVITRSKRQQIQKQEDEQKNEQKNKQLGKQSVSGENFLDDFVFTDKITILCACVYSMISVGLKFAPEETFACLTLVFGAVFLYCLFTSLKREFYDGEPIDTEPIETSQENNQSSIEENESVEILPKNLQVNNRSNEKDDPIDKFKSGDELDDKYNASRINNKHNASPKSEVAEEILHSSYVKSITNYLTLIIYAIAVLSIYYHNDISSKLALSCNIVCFVLWYAASKTKFFGKYKTIFYTVSIIIANLYTTIPVHT